MADKKTKKSEILRRLLNLIILLFAFSIVFIPAFLGAVMYFNAPVSPGNMRNIQAQTEGIKKGDGGEYFIEVYAGESAQSVGNRLERAGLIRNRHFWYLICRLGNEHLKTGTYQLEIPANQFAIYRLLVSGRQLMYRVTIPEGATLRKTAAILEENGVCSAEEFLAASKDPSILSRYRIPNSTIEGYLFPDTYLFPKEYPADRVIKAMADTFSNRLELLDPSVVNLSRNEINEKVVIASIVEREYRISEEAPLMAGVFYNRLKIGMALQSCATVEYIITEIQGRPHPSVLYNRDLEIRSPYNTYLVPGLPPGPISAPGTVALRAAFSPVQTEFLYFRLDDPQSGRHYFSKTLDEHIRAGQYILKNQ